MLIHNIQATALKGQSFTHALAPATVFTGRNDVGKTARMDAIKLVLVGYVPEQGKTNPATMAMASGPTMSVAADIQGHGHVERRWTQKAKTVSKQDVNTDSLPQTPLVLLDAAEYFGKSDAQRVQMVWEAVRVDLEKYSPLATHGKLRETAGKDFDLITTKFPEKKGEDLQAWMERLELELAEELKQTNAEVRRWEQTQQGITAAALQDTPVDADAVRNDMAQVRGLLDALLLEQGKLGALVRQQAGASEREEKVRQRIAGLEARLGERPVPTETAEKLQEQILELTTRRERMLAERRELEARATRQREQFARQGELAARGADGAIAQARLADTQRTIERMEGDLEKLGESTEEAIRAALEAAQEAKADLEARQRQNDANQTDLDQEVQKMKVQPCCPTCGTRGEQFHEMVDKLHSQRRSRLLGEAQEIGKEYQEALRGLQLARDAQNRDIAATRQRQNLVRQIADLKLAAEKDRSTVAMAKEADIELEAMGDLRPVELPSPAAIEALAMELAAKKEAAGRLAIAAELAVARAEHGNIHFEGPDDADQRAADVADRIEAHKGRLQEMEGDLQKANNQLADKRRLTQAEAEHGKAKKAAAVLGLVRDTLAEEKAQMIKATFGPLLATVEQFTAGILPTPLEYQRGELGRFEGSNWIPVRCFGGTYQAATYAGIQAALGSEAPSRIVIVDELGIFDPQNKRQFCYNVLKAIAAGVVDQFVGADVSAADYAGLEGLTVETLR